MSAAICNVIQRHVCWISTLWIIPSSAKSKTLFSHALVQEAIPHVQLIALCCRRIPSSVPNGSYHLSDVGMGVRNMESSLYCCHSNKCCSCLLWLSEGCGGKRTPDVKPGFSHKMTTPKNCKAVENMQIWILDHHRAKVHFKKLHL